MSYVSTVVTQYGLLFGLEDPASKNHVLMACPPLIKFAIETANEHATVGTALATCEG